MNRQIIIPALSAGPDYALDLIAAHELPQDLHGATVTLNCRLMEKSTRLFTTTLIRELTRRGARIELDGPPAWFTAMANDALGTPGARR